MAVWEPFSADYERKVVSFTSFSRKRQLLLELMRTGLVVDLGCGPLGLLVRDAARVRGARVIACDFSLPMILESRGRFQAPNLTHLVADNREVPLRSGSVSTVFSVNSFIPESRADAELMFREARRILQREGQLVAVLPAFEMSMVARDLWRMRVEVDMEGQRERDTSGWQCFYTKEVIADLMARLQFGHYRVSRIEFSAADEIAHVRSVYAGELLAVPLVRLEEHPLFEHLLVAQR